MDFKDTPEQASWRKEVSTFLAAEKPKSDPDASPQEMMERMRTMGREWREKLSAKGWVAPENREDGDGLCAERVGVCVDAEPVELEERHRSCAKDSGFLQGFDTMAGEDDGQGAQQRGVDAEEHAQW